jgi:hypothetical protein
MQEENIWDCAYELSLHYEYMTGIIWLYDVLLNRAIFSMLLRAVDSHKYSMRLWCVNHNYMQVYAGSDEGWNI